MGHQVALLRASDPDQAENGEVIFKIINITLLSTKIDPILDFLTDKNDTKIVTPIDLEVHQEMFELDPSTGALYIARALRPTDLGLLKLVVEASDLGTPSKSTSHALLFNIMDYQRVAKVMPISSDKASRTSFIASSSFQHQDLVVIVVMVAVAIVISLFLIVAMLFLRCPLCFFRDRDRNYNNSHAEPVFHQNLPVDAYNSHYLPEVFRDSHVTYVGDGNCENTLLKDGSLNSTDEAWLYPSLVQLGSEREKMLASRSMMPTLAAGANNTVFKSECGRRIRDERSQTALRSFLLLNKPDATHMDAAGRVPIEMTKLASSYHKRTNSKLSCFS